MSDNILFSAINLVSRNRFAGNLGRACREMMDKRWNEKGWYSKMPDVDAYDRLVVIRYALPLDVLDRTCLSKGRVVFQNFWNDLIYCTMFVGRDGSVFRWDYGAYADAPARKSYMYPQTIKHPNLITVTRPDGQVETGPHVWNGSPEGTEGPELSKEYVAERHHIDVTLGWGNKGVPIMRVIETGCSTERKDNHERSTNIRCPGGKRSDWVKVRLENEENLSTSGTGEVPETFLAPPWKMKRRPAFLYPSY